MKTFRETYDSIPRIWKQATAVVGFLASLGAVYAMANTFMGVAIRPAWAWEVAELSCQQYQTQLTLEQMNRREYQGHLNKLQFERHRLETEDEPIPDFLIDAISDAQNNVRVTDEEIALIQSTIIERDC